MAERLFVRRTHNLPAPAILAAKITEQLEAALEEFSNVEEVLADADETRLLFIDPL